MKGVPLCCCSALPLCCSSFPHWRSPCRLRGRSNWNWTRSFWILLCFCDTSPPPPSSNGTTWSWRPFPSRLNHPRGPDPSLQICTLNYCCFWPNSHWLFWCQGVCSQARNDRESPSRGQYSSSTSTTADWRNLSLTQFSPYFSLHLCSDPELLL